MNSQLPSGIVPQRHIGHAYSLSESLFPALRVLFIIGVLFTSEVTSAQIANNFINYTNGTNGTVCVSPVENDMAVLTAPTGTVFTTVTFASYGTPTGSCPTFAINTGCHQANSQSIVEGYLLGKNGTISIPATNGVFIDPCVNTVKKLSITANYTQPICKGSSPGTIHGTKPTGALLFTYSWEMSTTGPNSGFNTISGATDSIYTPGNLTQTTWYKRKASSFLLGSITSPVLQITVTDFPTVTATPTLTCVGGSSGTVTASGSGGMAPYTYNLNSDPYQSSATFNNLSAGSYTLHIQSSAGCISSTTATVSPYPNSGDNQNMAGTDSWVGHLYDGINFDSYKGHFTEGETFDEKFGGDSTCFAVSSGATNPSVYTEQFSVKFKMNSTKKGLYVADLGSDDGSRLTVDGTLIYNNWTDQAFSNKTAVLMNLTGSSSLLYEFYENTDANRVQFMNFTPLIENTLSGNLSQSVCIGSTGSAISGDVFSALPAGISGTYQWTYSNSPGGSRVVITGATAATYSPNTAIAPFNVAGTYYIYRNAKASSVNNIAPNPYTATRESNSAVLIVNSLSVGGSISPDATVCSGINSGSGTLSGYNGSILRWEISENGGPWTSLANTTATQAYSNLTKTTVGRAVVQSGACPLVYSGTVTVTVTPKPTATISYGGTPFCKNAGNVTVTRTGTAGGVYSSTSGLVINSTSGTVDLNSSTAGTYTITYTIASSGGCAAVTATTSIQINAIPAAPTVTTPVAYCQNALAVPLSATGSNLYWGNGPVAGSVGGTTALTTASWIDGAASNKKTIFKTTAPNVTITSVEYTALAWHLVSGLQLALYNSSGTVLAVSPTITSRSDALGGTIKVSNTFNYTIATPGNYSVGVYAGSASMGADAPTYPLTETTGTVEITGAAAVGAAPFHFFNNIKFTVDNGASAPTPSTTTPGTTSYVVSQTVNGCVSPQATLAVVVKAAPAATISYAASPYCAGGGSVTVTRTGTSGGSYSSTSGLHINASNGTINLNSSTPGTYTVTYSVAASGGCALYTATTSVTVKPNVGTPVFGLGASSLRCQAAGSITYSATATNTTGITYSLDATSLAAGNSISPLTGEVTFTAGWYGTSTIQASAGGCSPLTATHVVTTSRMPALIGVSTPACVGGNTGTITATGSLGTTPYTFSLDAGAFQSSNVFTTLAPSGYTLNVKSAAGCIASIPVSVGTYSISTDDPTTSGTDSWIGHIYHGLNFEDYYGYFPESEIFDEDFGGDQNCFQVSSSSGISSVYTDVFSVRFKMKSTRRGLYTVNLGSDDGSRLTIDGASVYNNWIDQSFAIQPGVLISLTGSSSLNYEFYENLVNNRVIFQNLTLVLANTLSVHTTQDICLGNSGLAISGDSFGPLPAGLSLSGTGYQWTYSQTPGGVRTVIVGATGASLVPDGSTAPFNLAGTYYVYRNALVSSTNNTGTSPYLATNESNAAVITVTPLPSATISYTNSPFCNTSSLPESVHFSGTAGGLFSASAGLSVDASTGAITPADNAMGNYTVTYSVNAGGGCSAYSTTTQVRIAKSGTWSGKLNTDWHNAGNWICGIIPDTSTNTYIPPMVSNYPSVISGPASTKNLTIGTGASLIIDGSINVTGAIVNHGNLNLSNGTLEMSGKAEQQISGSWFTGRAIQNLIISNTGAGLQVSTLAGDTLKITGTLTFGNPSSQLLTGDNITLVSNNGGTANVGVLGASNSINGKVIVERYVNLGTAPGQHGKSWQFLSTPTTGQTVKESWMENGLTPTGFGTQVSGQGGVAAGFDVYTATPSLKRYQDATNTWVGISNTAGQLYDPLGYMVFVRGDRHVTLYNQPANTTVLRSKGQLLTGDQPVMSVTPDHFKSVGNPYASVIDFTQINRTSGVDNEFYVWDPYLYGSYGLGGYQTLSSVNDWKPVPGGTPAYPSGIPCTTIESGQAFFVHATSTHSFARESFTLSFSESCKQSHLASKSFAREKTISGSQFLRASLYTVTGSTMADGNSVAFGDSFNDSIDGDDAIKIQNSGENFGLKRNGKILSVEAKASVKATDTLFYNMTNLSRSNYQLRFFPENMEGNNLQAFLVDQFLKTTTPLSLLDSSVLNFSVTADAASGAANRFKVVFKELASLTVTFNSIVAVQQQGDIRVEWNVENENGIGHYEVEGSTDGTHFEPVGAVSALNKGNAEYHLTDRQVDAGNHYYRVRSVSLDGKVTYSKVVKETVDMKQGDISIYPNPIVDGVIHLRLNGQPSGAYQIKILNSLGQVVIQKKINHAEGSSTEIMTLKNKSKGIYQLEVTKPNGNVSVIKIID